MLGLETAMRMRSAPTPSFVITKNVIRPAKPEDKRPIEFIRKAITASLQHLIPRLHDIEAAVAANLINAHEHSVAFALRVFVEFAFDRTTHDLLADFAVLMDCCNAVETPAETVFFVVEKHTNMWILFQIGRTSSERTVPEGDMLVVEDKRTAAKTHVGKAIVRSRCPNAV